jgi:formylglycine-generating enzyme required for sulfatase activity
MTPATEPVRIEPVDIRSKDVRHRHGKGGFWKNSAGLAVAILIAALAVTAWYVLTARRISIHIDPAPEHLKLEGGLLRIRVGEQVLLRPGSYRLVADKEGYANLDETLQVTRESHAFEFELQRLPGRVSLVAYEIDAEQTEIRDGVVSIDGASAGRTPVRDAEMAAGEHALGIEADRYLPFSTHIQVTGMGAHQEFRLPLTPGWAEVYVAAAPGETVVSIDDAEAGTVPLETELFPGTYRVSLRAEDYKRYTTQIVVEAHREVRLEGIQLELSDARLALTSDPLDSLVTVNEEFVGRTPLEIQVQSRIQHAIVISKAGYRSETRKLMLEPNETDAWVVHLEPVLAVVTLRVDPPDAELVVDGQSRGPVAEEISLTAVPHDFEIRKEGFRSYRTKVTPKVGFPQELVVSLEPAAAETSVAKMPSELKTTTGVELKRIEPGRVTMGASRREQGRRSNETLREAKLTKPFFMGAKEITNREFRSFRPTHNSGTIKTSSLNGDDQPVVSVSWQDAAEFCNWMSEKEGLPKVYEKMGEEMMIKIPVPDGYRLPTEAEWALCARTSASGEQLKYPWGNHYPPTGKSDNYADASCVALLANHLSEYRDGFVVSAPPGSFSPNRFGLYDLGGNVAEWCNDFYMIYRGNPKEVLIDPMGPEEGKFHVIRGSSWKQSGIGPLRWSYRDYGKEGKNDVGFRVCRTPAPKESAPR